MAYGKMHWSVICKTILDWFIGTLSNSKYQDEDIKKNRKEQSSVQRPIYLIPSNIKSIVNKDKFKEKFKTLHDFIKNFFYGKETSYYIVVFSNYLLFHSVLGHHASWKVLNTQIFHCAHTWRAQTFWRHK